MVVDLHEKLLEQVISERVNHHHGQLRQSLLEDSRHSILSARGTANVSIGGAVRALIQFLLKEPAADLRTARLRR